MTPCGLVLAIWLAVVLCAPTQAWAQKAGRADAAGLPAEIPLFPLPDVTLFPGVSEPYVIFEPRYREMVADALKGDRVIGMILLKPGFEADYEGRPPIYDIGCAGRIADSQLLPDGRYTIALRGFARFRVAAEQRQRPYRLARVEALPLHRSHPGRAFPHEVHETYSRGPSFFRPSPHQPTARCGTRGRRRDRAGRPALQ